MTQILITGCLVFATVSLLTPREAAAQGPRTNVAPVPRPRPAVDTPKSAPKMPPPTPVQPITTEYRLGAGDKIRIEVYRDPQLSQSAQVRPDGKVTLPLIGDIDASGKTPAELDDAITAALKEYVNNPSVTVIVVEATAATAYVVGGVNQPGAVQLQGNVTVLQALALAGGLSDFADRKNIRILRKSATGTQTIPFNYKEAIKGSTEAATYLRAGDTVVVPD
jgi:polysaccharide export outer membrane protein